MAVGGDVGMELVGDKEVLAMLKKLPFAFQRKVVVPAMRNGAKALRAAVIEKVSGRFFAEPTGTLLAALKTTKVKAAKRSPRGIKYNWPLPSADELNLDRTTASDRRAGKPAKDEGFYPLHVEYGYMRKGKHIPAKSFYRSTVNEMEREVLAEIGQMIRTKTPIIARKLAAMGAA